MAGKVVRGRRRGPWHPGTHLALLHAAPAAAVVGVGMACGLLASRGQVQPGRLALLAVVLAGNQYAAGALNDAVDAPADRAAGRAGKPILEGWISRRAAARLAVVAGGVSLVAAAGLGPVPALLAAVALACAWGYDLALKGTALSWLPFAVAVPLVPLIGYAAAGRLPRVLWWAWPVGGLLALAVHLADALPDVAADRAAGVRGLAARLGVRRAAALAAGAYAAGLVLAGASGAAGGDGRAAALGAGLAAAAGGAALLAGARGGPAGRRAAYRLLLTGVAALALGWVLAVRP